MSLRYMICPAMMKAGIKDAESKEGIDFCVKHCPYPYCILFDRSKDTNANKVTKRAVNKMLAWRLYCIKLPIREIADIIGRSKETVGKYLGEISKEQHR